MDGKNPGELSILVVDDDEEMPKLICAMLRRMNIDLIFEARSGEEAREHLSAAREPFSIVICDWEMPRMSGLDLFKQVHAG